MIKTTNKFSAEVRAHAVRLVPDNEGAARFALAGGHVDCSEDRLAIA